MGGRGRGCGAGQGLRKRNVCFPRVLILRVLIYPGLIPRVIRAERKEKIIPRPKDREKIIPGVEGEESFDLGWGAFNFNFIDD